MTKEYLVEISHERITPLTVRAEDRDHAIALALDNNGDPGDEYCGEIKVINIRRKHGEKD